MKVILFGATGMVGQGVLRRCLLDPAVESVLSIGRKPSGVSHPKLRDLVRADMFDSTVNAGELSAYDTLENADLVALGRRADEGS